MDDRKLKADALKVLSPLSTYHHQCHAASIELVRQGIATRVARGTCPEVGVHSWAVIGDCYDDDATIIDATLWSWRKDVSGIFVGKVSKYGHRPSGKGSIWDWGRPTCGTGKLIKLTPKFSLSRAAVAFMELLGPLDRAGWETLANGAPVQGWPAGEIFAAMDDTKALTAVVPIDKLGMLTDRNPGKLYLPEGNP